MKKLLEKINNKERKKIVIEIVSVLVLMTLFIGVSIAGGYWTYKSSTANTLETGSVSMTFLESNSVIDITNALPKSDNAGKTQTDLFEFAVTTNSGPTQTISYDISIEPIVVETGYTGLNPEDIKVYLTDKEGNVLVNPTKLSDLEDFKLYSNKHKHITEDTRLTSKYVLRAWIDGGVRATDWYKEYTDSNIQYQYKFRVNVNGKSVMEQDTSGANAPVLSDNMIPVYYDEDAEVWKKADSANENPLYRWYNYNSKMWANSVTVSSTKRSTYLNADPGTTIPMDDILTMQVWIPRYKYKVFNYNADGTVASEPQEIEIMFESGTETTGEISCTDSISGTDGAVSETCKLKSTNATCTDATCNGKTYTHPAFTFGTEQLEGIWVGKFEVSAPTDSTCYASASSTNCNKTGITPLVKPDVKSYRYAQVGTFESNMMAMNDSDNIYGLATTVDTHMMKNMEWGAVAYLSHSKYGTCTDGTCTEININNSSYYTGRSGGSTSASSTADGTYKYNQTKVVNKTIIDGTGTTITPTITNDTTYPWTETDGLYKSSTQGVNSSTTNLTFSFTAPSDNTYLSFDWSVSTEDVEYDYIYYTITKDETALSDTGTSTKIGGTNLGTTEDALTYKSVARQLESGSYEITFTYVKDDVGSGGTDTGYVKNIKILDSPTVNTEVTPIGEGKDGPSASTTGNIYGIYDMSGGAYDYVMGNMVSNDGTTMMSGFITSSNSGYTGIIYGSGSYTSYTGTYSYPENKYIDKYSFGTDATQKIRSKLGDATKEVYNTIYYGWYSDDSSLAYPEYPWFDRGGNYSESSSTGVFNSLYNCGVAVSDYSSRLVITP